MLTYVSEQPMVGLSEDVGFFATSSSSEITNDPDQRLDKREVYRAGLRELSRSQPSGGRLLDVGCGFGLFLEDARSAGWQPFGVDVSEVGIRYAREELGLRDVQRRDLRDAAYPDGYFQAVTLWNLLEHVADPLATMREVERILVPQGGIALVRVPNMVVHHALWRARPVLTPFAILAGRRLPPYLGGISPPQHLYGFTPRTTRALLHRAGLSNIVIQLTRPHNAGSPLGVMAQAVAKSCYAVSRGRSVLSPAFVAYGRASGLLQRPHE